MSESKVDVISCGSLSLCEESGTAAVQGMHHMMGSEAVTQLSSDTDRQETRLLWVFRHIAAL